MSKLFLKHLRISGLILASLCLQSCIYNDDNLLGLALIGEENCIICIKTAESSKGAAALQRQSAAWMDEYGNSRNITSRYGTIATALYAGTDEREILLFNGKAIMDAMNPPHYSDDPDGDIVGLSFSFSKPWQLGDLDIIPFSTYFGGNSQIKTPHFLLIIGKDKKPLIFAENRMFSKYADYKIDSNGFHAEYDRILVNISEAGLLTFPKNMRLVPAGLCRDLYDNRIEFAESWRRDKSFSGLSMALARQIEAAQDYSAFSEQKLLKAAKRNISFDKFAENACM